jgi:hypothetical protein
VKIKKGSTVLLFFFDGLVFIGDGGTFEIRVSATEESAVGTCDGDSSIILWKLEAY